MVENPSGGLGGQLHRCSINTATLGHRSPIEQVIETVARQGFGWIAPWRRDLAGADLGAVRRQLDDAGLGVSSLCRSTYFPGPNAEARLAAIDDNRKALDQAAALGAKSFIMVVGSLPEGSRSLSDARLQVEDGIATLLDHARSVGVPLAVEPLHPMYAADRSCVSTIDQALDLCAAVASDDKRFLGVAIDVYHCWWDPELFAAIVRAGAAERIIGFHLCDWLLQTRDFLLDRGMMGDGVVDLPPIRRAIETAGYTGPFEVEIFSRDGWWLRDEAQVVAICAERLQTHC